MKVWIENPFDNLPGDGHRAERYALMAAAFAAAGHAVTFFSSDFSHASKTHRAIPPHTPPGIAIKLVPTLPYRRNVSFARIRSHRAYARAWLALARLTILREGAPDVIIVSVPPISTGDAALRLKSETGALLVVDVMDAWPETFRRLVPPPFRFICPVLFARARRAVHALYRGADLLTGVCERYRALAVASGAGEYRRFYHGIACDAPPRVRERTSSNAPRIAYVGNLGLGYDLRTVLRALATLPDAQLDIAGAGEQEPVLRRLARTLGLDSRVRFHGYLESSALRTLLTSCDVGVIPLADESFVGLPYKLGDYAAAGLSVASSLDGETGELLRRYGVGVTYRSGDVADCARALEAACALHGDVRGLLAEIDAATIYREYVDAVALARNK